MTSKTSKHSGQAAFASGDDDGELARLLRFGALGWGPPEGAVVFVPTGEAEFAADWEQWLRGAVAGSLGEHVLAVRSLGDEMKAREILVESVALDGALDADAALRSRRAGAGLLGVVASARQARLAARVAALLGNSGADREGIHLATAVALHSVVFPLPPHAALLAYAFAEWRAGLVALGHPAARADAARFLAEGSVAGEWAGALLRGSRNSFSSASFG